MPISRSYFPNYYSIDDILATQERTPCKFLHVIPKLGNLNPASEDPDISPGTQLELPMWLALEITTGRQPLIQVELPKVYKEAYREILTADACAVNLHKFGLYFYELGLYARNFDSRSDVIDILVHTFSSRFRKVMDLAENTISDHTVVSQLDMLERSIFKNANFAYLKQMKWLQESTAPLEAAQMVVNHKKRKRAELEEVE